MSTRMELTQTITDEWGCEICGSAKGTLVTYATRSAVTRNILPDRIVNSWVETKWDLCETCAKHLDNDERAALMERATDDGDHDEVYAKLLVDDLLNHLSRGRVTA